MSVMEQCLLPTAISPNLSVCWNYFSTLLEVITCKFLEQCWWVQKPALSTNYFYTNTQKYAFVPHHPKESLLIFKCNSSVLPWLKHLNSSTLLQCTFDKKQVAKKIDIYIHTHRLCIWSYKTKFVYLLEELL